MEEESIQLMQLTGCMAGLTIKDERVQLVQLRGDVAGLSVELKI